MGSPNFSHDKILYRTFGYVPGDDSDEFNEDSIKDSILQRIESIDTNLFQPIIVMGYHSGFVIHTKGVCSSYQVGTDNKEYILDQMHNLIKDQLKDRDLLETFMDGSADAVIRERQNTHEDETPRSTEYLYILEVLSNASEYYEQFKWILDSHTDGLMRALEQAGVKITDDADVEDLYCSIDEVLDPKAIREAVNDCIEADIERLEEEIILIAQEYGLQVLQGVTWTSHLADADYDAILAEYNS